METLGVLALQGDYEAHGRMAASLGLNVREVKQPKHLEGCEALLLPGGESSTMMKLLRSEELLGPVSDFCRSGRPVLGTCAGAILLASAVSGPAQESLGILDMDIERNAYGRQLDSTIMTLDGRDAGGSDIEAVFIRAPVIRRVGAGLEVLLRRDDDPVLVRQGAVWAATFHPEMTSDTSLLQLVLESGTA
jgi:5'-phosphate synthase pdxT subunit